MCGILVKMGSDNEVDDQVIASLRHRGVREKTFHAKYASMTHIRLPIIGLGEEYDQPVFARGDKLIGFVGELLDFKEMNESYVSDLQAVVDTWTGPLGPWGFKGFDGFWHSVCHNTPSGVTYAVTDYLNQKPLYYRVDNHPAICSELDPLSLLGPSDHNHLDQVYLSAVAKWGYCPDTERTPYEYIKKSRPGEMLTFDKFGALANRSIIDPLVPAKVTDYDLLQHDICKAIKLRVLSSDVPVSALVSGGLDSSIVYMIAKRYGDIQPYHIENEEWEACEVVAPDAIRLSLEDYPTMEKALGYMQEPIDLGSLLPQVALSDKVRATGDTRVCLTGDGADEMFGGYGRAFRYDSQWSDIYHELVNWHLPRLDRVMMKNRIEIRSPFLSRRVAELALGMPRSDRTGKECLRRAFVSDLPRSIIRGKKKPLKTTRITEDRETNSVEMIRLFIDNLNRRVTCLSDQS
jgi:asparagine synthase (glutamine-hydrolysing)